MDVEQGKMTSRSEQQPGRMAEEEKQESDSHAPTSGPPVPECNLNRPSLGPQAAEIEKTCWQRFLGSRLVVYCLGLPESRVAMLLYALLALSPVVDILSDVLTAANFALSGHPWWATTTMVVFYMSGRFTVVFMALCPTPSAWNLMCLYLPGCWLSLKREETPGAVVAGDPAVVVRGGESGAGAANPLGDPQPRPPHDQQPEAGIQRPAGAPRPTTEANPQLVKMTRNRFTTLVDDVLTLVPQVFDHFCPCTIYGVALAMEIVLIPFACLAIIPIGISAFSLAGSYLAAGLGSSDGADANVDDDVRKKANLFLQTVSIVEALLESVPQLALQIRAGVYGGELAEWVFVFSVSVSAFCITKAVVGFVFNHHDIWDTFQGLQERVIEFTTRPAGAPPPPPLSGRWTVATAAEVTHNPDLLRQGGLGDWYIANLQDGMQVNGPERGYRVEPNNAVLGHTIYSRKR